MIKSITLLGALLVTCMVYAQDVTVSDKPTQIQSSKEVVVLKPSGPKSAVELPEAVLRLHDLEKREYKGETIYTHIPLELAKIKNPVKTV